MRLFRIQRYRAAYDFMLLRSLLGHVPESLVQWWELLRLAWTEQTRAGMIAEAQREARDDGRRRSKPPPSISIVRGRCACGARGRSPLFEKAPPLAAPFLT